MRHIVGSGNRMITLPSERIAKLRAELAQLEAERAGMWHDSHRSRKLDNLIAARQATLAKLERVAADLERVTRRRTAS